MLIKSLFLESLFTLQHYDSFEVRPYDYVAEYRPLEERRLQGCDSADLATTQELKALP